jgi:hypothetical protein
MNRKYCKNSITWLVFDSLKTKYKERRVFGEGGLVWDTTFKRRIKKKDNLKALKRYRK